MAPTQGETARAQSKHFSALLIDQAFNLVTVSNVIVVGVSADVAIGWVGWTFIDIVFAVFFLAEMLMKIKALGIKRYFVGPDRSWNILEAILVALAIAEISVIIFEEYVADGEGAKGKTSMLCVKSWGPRMGRMPVPFYELASNSTESRRTASPICRNTVK